MDQQRRERDEQAWRARGNYGPMPERLYQEHELPPIYKVEPQWEKVEEPVYDASGARRQRKAAGNIHYDDGLTEDQLYVL